MALTPEDVVHKQFQHVRFKDGFDPDEVDDYLDEIVIEWRKTIEENNELKARIATLESAQGAAPVAAPAPVAAVPEPVQAQTESPVDASAGIIAVAQRVHDEYVTEGKSKRAQIIAEAEGRATQIVQQAETRQREELERLNTERASLETKISELREFESAYRTQLRSYFEGQLSQLDGSAGAAATLGQ